MFNLVIVFLLTSGTGYFWGKQTYNPVSPFENQFKNSHRFEPKNRFARDNFLGLTKKMKSNNYKLKISPDAYSANKTYTMFSGEFLVDTSIEYGPSCFYPAYPSIAFDGTNYLVVWEDSRSDLDSSDIWGTRVSQDGTILDPAGIPISTAGNEQSEPCVAFDGTNYLVVWEDRRNEEGYIDIYGARVDKSGNVLDPSGIEISITNGRQFTPVVVFGGTNYLVLWTDCRSGVYCDIYGARVETSGNVLDIVGIPIISETNEQCYPSATFDGTNYFVAWMDYRSDTYDIYGARVSQSGTVLDAGGILISGNPGHQLEVSTAFDGTNYLVVWEDHKDDFYSSDIYGARVDTSGTLLDTTGIPISSASYRQCNPCAGFDGTNYFISWEDNRLDEDELYGARLSKSGVVLDTEGVRISSPAYEYNAYPQVAFGDTNYLIIWMADIEFMSNIFGTRVDVSGEVLDTPGIVVSTSANTQMRSSVIFDGSNYFAVYYDSRNCVYGARIDSGGTVLDPGGICISSSAVLSSYISPNPSIAFDGTNYLVAWGDGRNGYDVDIYGARIDKSGNILDEVPIAVLPGSQVFPRMVFGKNNYFVVWYNDSYEMKGTRITPSGTVLDPQGTTILEYGYPCSVGFDGNNYFILYYGMMWYSMGLCAAIVDTGGMLVDSVFISSANTFNPWEPYSLAFDGKNYLIVESVDTAFYDDYSIYAMRVTPAGEVLDTTPIAVAGNGWNETNCSACFNGTDYVIVWSDERKGVNNADIYGCLLDTAGGIVDRFTVSNLEGYQIYPSITVGSGGQLLSTYTGWTPAPYNTARIWARLSPFTGVEENNSSVLSGVQLVISPNPSARFSNIKYSLSTKTKVSLKLYDITGRNVKTLVNSEQPSGNYSVPVNTKDLSTGIYFVKFVSNCHSERREESNTIKITKKLILIK